MSLRLCAVAPEARGSPVVRSFRAVVAEARGSPVVRSFRAVVAEARGSPVVQRFCAVVAEARGSPVVRRFCAVVVVALVTGAPALAGAETVAVRADRVVARFFAPETGGVGTPQFVFERILAFEARLEALADPHRSRVPDAAASYRERHIRSALDRHVAEVLLAALRIDPEPTRAEMLARTAQARAMMIDRAGGDAPFREAAAAEGVAEREVIEIARRRARASLYLDRMVAPMVEPSEAELRNVHRSAATPFRDLPFDAARGALRRWYVGQRFEAALAAFHQNARSRVRLTIIEP